MTESVGITKLRLTTKFAPIYIDLSLIDKLAAIATLGEVEAWLQRPNDVFDGATPLELIRDGRTDKIEEMVDFINYGCF